MDAGQGPQRLAAGLQRRLQVDLAQQIDGRDGALGPAFEDQAVGAVMGEVFRQGRLLKTGIIDAAGVHTGPNYRRD